MRSLFLAALLAVSPVAYGMSCGSASGHAMMRAAVHAVDRHSAGPWATYVRTLPQAIPVGYNALSCLVVVKIQNPPYPSIKMVRRYTVERLSHGRGWYAWLG